MAEYDILGTHNSRSEIREAWKKSPDGTDPALAGIPESEQKYWNVYMVITDNDGNMREVADPR